MHVLMIPLIVRIMGRDPAAMSSVRGKERSLMFRFTVFDTFHLCVGDHISCRKPFMYFRVAVRIAAFEMQK